MAKAKIFRIPGKFTHKGAETVFGDRHWSFITPGAFTLGEAKRLQDWANRLVAHLEHAKEQKNAEIEKRRERTRAKKASKVSRTSWSLADVQWDKTRLKSSEAAPIRTRRNPRLK